ncbi:hypothetical protein PV325_006595 [Microctonus aethiopoides]|nr:hypothetical protein PV325_006595 [Microctonus aethiopoides]
MPADRIGKREGTSGEHGYRIAMLANKCRQTRPPRQDPARNHQAGFLTMRSDVLDVGAMANNLSLSTFSHIALCLMALTTVISADEKSTNTLSVSSSPPAGQSKTIQKLIKILERYSQEGHKGLKRVYLSNRSITCNDGSQAGFYLRKSHGSKKWIIFLEGGWYCYDQKSCRNRWLKLRHLMTSTQWADTRDVGGILSPNPEENPHWWNVNHVFVPYCTSDSWSGTRSSPNDMFSFMGAEIVSQVVRDLVPLGLDNASSLLLAGSSAGGTGVMLNLDHIHGLVHHELGLKHVSVRGISDSGWFLDRAPYSPNGLSPVEAVRKGMELWRARMPKNCAAVHPHEPWRCYFGYRLYPTLSAPLFVFQWLFDEAQMTADNVGAPVTKQQWDYIHKMGDSLRQTFDNVTAVFAPSCISHSVLTKRDWQLVKIDSVTLSQALHCWDKSSLNNNHHRVNETSIQLQTNLSCAKTVRKLSRAGHRKGNDTIITNGKNSQNNNGTAVNIRKNETDLNGKTKLSNNNGSTENRKNKRRRRRRKHKGKRRERNKDGKNKDRREKHPRRKEGRRQRNKFSSNNHTFVLNGTRPQRSVKPSAVRRCGQECNFRLIERCTWPQCNHSCPKLHNPFTGEEMDFIELLKSFGLDMKSVANALGIDINTLNNMDHDELLNLLTQQAN